MDKGKYRILGIDPGSRIAGYALVDSYGNKMDLIDFGTVKLNHGYDGEKLNQLSYNKIKSPKSLDLIYIKKNYYGL